ncbi:ABC transporter ATP-binding protein [Dysgonomonas sp. Marseille-P4677]|uniref:ABC transporter ATP-binding protein n=1 Tax=Dysgonomonas sp. Marseille-P4677 TaxID=2364790 RepID=UPI0019115D31|nr:ABC transporter ATP-binding protein [Dysgonomonas sp. Marseille-P4677]MBK5720560.1 ABC transporter ATP-binding protein [Dysgonomonas sp. Marseille-P4677]
MITINNLSFYYNKKRPVFENVSFNLRGGIYGLLGENGVGKTTFLHLISGLSFPKKGSCKVFENESAYRNPNMLKQLFFLPEEFNAPSIPIKEFIKYNSVFYPHFSEVQFDTYLNDFQVEKDRKMSELSFGQKKKTLIAYALALNTPITLLDEPTNGLDIPSKSQFRKIVSSAFDDEKCILISTHQVRDLESLIDPIIILDRNQVLLNNSIEEITQKLLFSLTPNKPEDALYWEQTMQGYLIVEENKYKEESTLNIEALFNTVVNNKKRIKELFNNSNL